MRKISISLMPLFRCNCNCDYCYLGKDKPKDVLSYQRWEQIREKIETKFEIESIDFYGGEVGLLSPYELENYARVLKNDKLNVITSFPYPMSNIFPYANSITVSLNPERPDLFRAIQQIRATPKHNLHIAMVATPQVLRLQLKPLMYFCLDHEIKGLHMMEYSPSIKTGDLYPEIKGKYPKFMKKLKEVAEQYGVPLDNIDGEKALESTHLFVMPNGNFACLDYDENGLEFFREFEDLDDWDKFVSTTDKETLSDCLRCVNFLSCPIEHKHVFKNHNTISCFDFADNYNDN